MFRKSSWRSLSSDHLGVFRFTTIGEAGVGARRALVATNLTMVSGHTHCMELKSVEEVKETVKKWQSALSCPECEEGLLKREAYEDLGKVSLAGGITLTVAISMLPAATSAIAVAGGALSYFGVWAYWERFAEKVDPLSMDQLYLERIDEDTVICTHCGNDISEEQTSIKDF